MAWGRQGALVLGSQGILRPGKLAWLRALAWMLSLLLVLVVILSLQSVVRSISPNPNLALAMAFLCTALAYASYYWLVRWGERRHPSELVLGSLARDYGLGLLAGSCLISLVMGCLWLFGLYEIRAGNWFDWMHDVRETVGTGLLEELLARLVIFRLISRAFGVPAGMLISAAIFGAAHLLNANASIAAAIAIAIEAGLLFAGFYFLSGRIWISAGAHAAWNLTLGGIFGATVSGMPTDGSLFHSIPVAGSAPLLTGGGFGPEASLPAILLGFAAFLITIRLAPRAVTTQA